MQRKRRKQDAFRLPKSKALVYDINTGPIMSVQESQPSVQDVLAKTPSSTLGKVDQANVIDIVCGDKRATYLIRENRVIFEGNEVAAGTVPSTAYYLSNIRPMQRHMTYLRLLLSFCRYARCMHFLVVIYFASKDTSASAVYTA